MPNKTPKWGIGSYSVPWNLSVPGYEHPERIWTALDIVHEAKILGCTVVQLCDNAHLDQLDESALAEIKENADCAGITIETGLRGVEPDQLMRHLDIACSLGAKRIRTLVDSETSHPDTLTAVEYLRQVMPSFAEHNIELMLENHDQRSSMELRSIIEQVGSPFLGICLDTVNSLGIEETKEQVIAILLPYIKCLHIKDFTIHRMKHNMGFLVEGTPAGDGMLGCETIIKKAVEQQPDVSIVIEQWTPWQGDIQKTVALELEWLRHSTQTISAIMQNYTK